MKRKTLELTLIFGLINLLQLVTQIVVTRIFGATVVYDSFLMAVALPTIIVTVIYGTLSDAFMPLYSEKGIRSTDQSKYLSNSLFYLVLLGVIISSVLTLFSYSITQILYPNVTNMSTISDSVSLFKVLVWVIPLALFATLLGSVWYYKKSFIRFPLAQLIGGSVSLITTILLYRYIGIWSLAVGFLLNIIIQPLFLLPSSKPSIGNLDLSLLFPLLISWIPLIISSFAVRSDTLIIRSLGSQLGEGQLVYLNLVSKMYSLGSGVVTIGLQVLLLPHLLESFVNKNYDKAKKLVNKTKLIATLFSVFSSLLILLLGPVLIRLLFVGGKFDIGDYEATRSLFPIFLIPSFAWGLNSIFFQPLIALKKQWLLGFINVISLVIAWLVASYAFALGWGASAISLGIGALLFGGIIGSEIAWQIEKQKLHS